MIPQAGNIKEIRGMIHYYQNAKVKEDLKNKKIANSTMERQGHQQILHQKHKQSEATDTAYLIC